MNRIKKLTVRYHDRPVGVMALYQNRQVAFEYTNEMRLIYKIAAFHLK